MNPMERVLHNELADLIARLASSVPEGALEAVTARDPALRDRLEAADARLAALRGSLLDGYGAWQVALGDLENLWTVVAVRSATQEPVENTAPLAA
jgi:hypothetical protein